MTITSLITSQDIVLLRLDEPARAALRADLAELGCAFEIGPRPGLFLDWENRVVRAHGRRR